MNYIQASIDAEERLKRGERQQICVDCCKWRWDDEQCCRGIRKAAHEYARDVRDQSNGRFRTIAEAKEALGL